MTPGSMRTLFLFLIFLCGAIFGALLQNMLDHKWLHPAGHLPVFAAPEPATIEYFRKELSLSSAQVEELNRILNDAVRQHRDVNSFTEHIKEETNEQIRKMLDPSQKARFDELLRESRRQEHQGGN